MHVTSLRDRVEFLEEEEEGVVEHELVNASIGHHKASGEFAGFRVLIPFASIGGGHKAAGKAIMQQLARDMPEVEVVMVDTVEDNEVQFADGSVDANHPNEVTKRTKTDFLKLRAAAPALTKIGVEWTDFMAPVRIDQVKGPLGGLLRAVKTGAGLRLPGVAMVDKFDEFMLRHRWDLVINVHYFSAHSIAALRAVSHMDIPSVTVITDFHAHAVWLANADHFFVPAPDVAADVVKRLGTPESAVTVSGIPVDPKVADLSQADEATVWKKLGSNIEAKLKPPSGGRLILVTTTCEVINDALSVWEKVFQFARANPHHRVVAVAARLTHSKLPQDQIAKGVKGLDVLGKELAADLPNVEVLGFIPTMPEYMRLADVIISKPGGLTVSESLALGTAWLIMEPWLLDVEFPNRDFMVKEDIAKNVKAVSEIPGILSDLFSGNGDKVETMKANALRLGHPYAAKAVSDYVAGLFRSKRAPSTMPPSLCCCSKDDCLALSDGEGPESSLAREGCSLTKDWGGKRWCPSSCATMGDIKRMEMNRCRQ